jgi:dienelactone hydrolase
MPCIALAPTTGGPHPGVVAIHQHNNELHLGKSEPAGMAGNPEMAYGLELARQGAVTIIPDLSGFEERSAAFADRVTGEMFEAWNLVASGQSLLGRHVHDIMMAVTWLAGRPDAEGRCGVFGHSLGGQVGFFAMACDDRIAAGALNCGVGTLRSFRDAHILHNPSWYVPGLASLGDTDAVAAVLAEQRVWLSYGTNDPIFPTVGVADVIAAFAPGAATHHPFDGGHGLPASVRAQASSWLISALRSS